MMKKNLVKTLSIGMCTLALLTVPSSTIASAAQTNGAAVESLSLRGTIIGDVEYQYSNYSITGQNSFSGSIQLTNTKPYGKAFYSNTSNSNVTIDVYKNGSSYSCYHKTVAANRNSTHNIKFNGAGSYKVVIRSQNGATNLNCYFSLGKSAHEL